MHLQSETHFEFLKWSEAAVVIDIFKRLDAYIEPIYRRKTRTIRLRKDELGG